MSALAAACGDEGRDYELGQQAAEPDEAASSATSLES
jgi:hypothetical protein